MSKTGPCTTNKADSKIEISVIKFNRNLIAHQLTTIWIIVRSSCSNIACWSKTESFETLSYFEDSEIASLKCNVEYTTFKILNSYTSLVKIKNSLLFLMPVHYHVHAAGTVVL